MSKLRVDLVFYKPDFEILFKNYRLPPEQLKYTQMPLEALKICDGDKERFPIVIMCNGQVAGFFVLHGWGGVKEFSNNKDAILLRAYSIEQSYQGKGIAKNSLQLLPVFVRENFPDKKEIILAVNHKNIVAQQVYAQAGFADNGIRAMGSIGEMFILQKDLSSEDK